RPEFALADAIDPIAMQNPAARYFAAVTMSAPVIPPTTS
ncbi:unnamed protein product, partial [marine sediment metagenome]